MGKKRSKSKKEKKARKPRSPVVNILEKGEIPENAAEVALPEPVTSFKETKKEIRKQKKRSLSNRKWHKDDQWKKYFEDYSLAKETFLKSQTVANKTKLETARDSMKRRQAELYPKNRRIPPSLAPYKDIILSEAVVQPTKSDASPPGEKTKGFTKTAAKFGPGKGKSKGKGLGGLADKRKRHKKSQAKYRHGDQISFSALRRLMRRANVRRYSHELVLRRGIGTAGGTAREALNEFLHKMLQTVTVIVTEFRRAKTVTFRDVISGLKENGFRLYSFQDVEEYIKVKRRSTVRRQSIPTSLSKAKPTGAAPVAKNAESQSLLGALPGMGTAAGKLAAGKAMTEAAEALRKKKAEAKPEIVAEPAEEVKET